MPTKILDSVEKRVASFITPLSWAKLRLFSAIDEIYGIRSTLQDLRLTDVAQILQVHELRRHLTELDVGRHLTEHSGVLNKIAGHGAVGATGAELDGGAVLLRENLRGIVGKRALCRATL